MSVLSLAFLLNILAGLATGIGSLLAFCENDEYEVSIFFPSVCLPGS